MRLMFFTVTYVVFCVAHLWNHTTLKLTHGQRAKTTRSAYTNHQFSLKSSTVHTCNKHSHQQKVVHENKMGSHSTGPVVFTDRDILVAIFVLVSSSDARSVHQFEWPTVKVMCINSRNQTQSTSLMHANDGIVRMRDLRVNFSLSLWNAHDRLK